MSKRKISMLVVVIMVMLTTYEVSMAQTPLPIKLKTDPGNASIELSWNATDGVKVTHYRISRKAQGQTSFTVIQDKWTETTFFDKDSSLTKETSYCYQVEAIQNNIKVSQTGGGVGGYNGVPQPRYRQSMEGRQNNETVYTKSNESCTRYGELSLWVPNVKAKVDEKDVIVPINIRNAEGLKIGATDIWLNFDSKIIKSVALSRTTLTAGYAWETNVQTIATGQRVRISALETDNYPELYGDGSLFWLVFDVLGPAGSQSALDLQDFVSGVGGGGSTIYTPDNLNTHIPLTLNDGTLTVEQEIKYVLGDLNGNGVVQAVDALFALRIASGKIEPTIEQRYAGDINGNEVIEAADASLILTYAATGQWPTLPGKSRSAHNRQATQTTLNLATDGNVAAGGVVEVTLQATNLQQFAGGTFVMTYDPALIQQLVEAKPTGLARNFTRYSSYDNGQGRLAISLADRNEISGKGDLVVIRLQLADNISADAEPTLRLANAKLNDRFGRDFVTAFPNNQIVRQSTTLAIAAGRSTYLPLIIR